MNERFDALLGHSEFSRVDIADWMVGGGEMAEIEIETRGS